MNPVPVRLLVLAATACVAGALLAEAPMETRSARIKRQIDALLALRRNPVALPVDPPNPFTLAVTGTAGREPAAGDAAAAGRSPAVRPVMREEDEGASNATVLARLASRLRIGGLIRIKDQMQVVINDSPWREGESIVVEREPRIIQVQVVRIAPGQVTLRLEDAELMIRF